MAKYSSFSDSGGDDLLCAIVFKNYIEHMSNEEFSHKYNILISSGVIATLGEDVQHFLHEESRRRSKGPEQS